jgi:hypothetical protein
MTAFADIAGDNGTHSITFTGQARWVQFIVAGAGTVRIGGASSTSSTVGLPVAAGGGYCTPSLSFYYSGEFSAYVPTGATLSYAIKEV